MPTVLTTPTFDRQARAAGLTDDELAAIASGLAAEPGAGELMVGTGGYRTIHYFGGEDVPVFLLALVDKGSRANLSKAERNALAAVLPRLADAYRAGAARRVREKGKT